MWPLRGTGRTYVHIVGTRFCLKQGHNAALVEARLLLFERICVPTMAQQSTNRFVWLVIVDETLAPRHRRRLTTLLAAHRGPKDFRVVSLDRETANRDLRAQGHHAFGLARLRQPSIVADYVLTTVLDADDGLPYQALRMIREQVADAVRRDVVQQVRVALPAKETVGENIIEVDGRRRRGARRGAKERRDGVAIQFVRHGRRERVRRRLGHRKRAVALARTRH